jgi:hypothetical protein
VTPPWDSFLFAHPLHDSWCCCWWWCSVTLLELSWVSLCVVCCIFRDSAHGVLAAGVGVLSLAVVVLRRHSWDGEVAHPWDHFLCAHPLHVWCSLLLLVVVMVLCTLLWSFCRGTPQRCEVVPPHSFTCGALVNSAPYTPIKFCHFTPWLMRSDLSVTPSSTQ